MSILRAGDIVAIIAKVSGVSADGSEADIYFHMDDHYNENEVILVNTNGLKLMEHGDPDYGVKIIEGIEGEWEIQSRLSKTVAVMQKIDSDPNIHENFQVVAIDRLKTQDKNLYRLVTGADLKKIQSIESTPEKTQNASIKQPHKILKGPSLKAEPVDFPTLNAENKIDASTPSETSNAENTIDASAPSEEIDEKAANTKMAFTMMRPNKLRNINNPPKIMGEDKGIQEFVKKADELAEESLQRSIETTKKIDLSTIADESVEYKTNTKED